MIVELKLPLTPILKEVSLEDLSLTQKEWDALSPEKKKIKLREYVAFYIDQPSWEVTNWSEVKF